MKIIELNESVGVSRNLKSGLVSNHINHKSLENIKAIFEISRIVNGQQYTMQDVWSIYSEDLANEIKFLPKTSR